MSACIHCNAMRDEIRELRKVLGLSGRESDKQALRRAYKLTAAEAALVQALYDAGGQTVPRYTLAEITVSDAALMEGSDALKIHVSNARQKVGADVIGCDRSVGYFITDAGRALVYAVLQTHSEAA